MAVDGSEPKCRAIVKQHLPVDRSDRGQTGLSYLRQQKQYLGAPFNRTCYYYETSPGISYVSSLEAGDASLAEELERPTVFEARVIYSHSILDPCPNKLTYFAGCFRLQKSTRADLG